MWDTKKFFLLDDGTKSWSSLLVFVRRVKERDFFYLIAHIPLLFFALSKYGTLNLRIGEVTLRERFHFMEHNKNLARGEVRVAALFFRREREREREERDAGRGEGDDSREERGEEDGDDEGKKKNNRGNNPFF